MTVEDPGSHGGRVHEVVEQSLLVSSNEELKNAQQKILNNLKDHVTEKRGELNVR